MLNKLSSDFKRKWGLALEEPSISNPAQITTGKAPESTLADFANCGNIVSRKTIRYARNSPGISGSSLRVYLSLLTSASAAIGLLSCGLEHTEQTVRIPLTNTASDEYFRPRGCPSVLLLKPAPTPLPKFIHIENNFRSKTPAGANRQCWFLIDGYAERDLELIDIEPRACWDKEEALIKSKIGGDKDTPLQTFVRLRSVKGS